MANRAYVGNLPFSFTSAELTDLFQGFGTVRSAEIVSDRETGRSRGFGFVEMDSPEALKAAMSGLDGKAIAGRNLTVNEARERTARPAGDRPSYSGGGGGGGYSGGPPRGGGGGYSGGGGGGGGGYGGGGGGGGRGRPDRGGDRGGERGSDRGSQRGGGRGGGRPRDDDADERW
jgi:hypothetical protein